MATAEEYLRIIPNNNSIMVMSLRLTLDMIIISAARIIIMSKVNLKDITIMELLLGIIRRYSSAVAMQIKEGGHFRSLTYTRIGMRVSNTSYALKKLGLMKGERA